MFYLKGFIIDTELISNNTQEKIFKVLKSKIKESYGIFNNTNIILYLNKKSFFSTEDIEIFIFNLLKDIIDELNFEIFIKFSDNIKWIKPIRKIFLLIESQTSKGNIILSDYFESWSDTKFLFVYNKIFTQVKLQEEIISKCNYDLEALQRNIYLDKLYLNSNCTLKNVKIDNVFDNINTNPKFYLKLLKEDLLQYINIENNQLYILCTEKINYDIFTEYITLKVFEYQKIIQRDILFVKSVSLSDIKNEDVLLFSKVRLSEKIDLLNTSKILPSNYKDIILKLFISLKLSIIKLIESKNDIYILNMIDVSVDNSIFDEMCTINIFLDLFFITKYNIQFSSSSDLGGIRKIIIKLLHKLIVNNNSVLMNFINEILNNFKDNEYQLRTLILSRINLFLKNFFKLDTHRNFVIAFMKNFSINHWKTIFNEVRDINISEMYQHIQKTLRRIKGVLKISEVLNKEISNNQLDNNAICILRNVIKTPLYPKEFIKMIATINYVLDNTKIKSLQDSQKTIIINLLKKALNIIIDILK